MEKKYSGKQVSKAGKKLLLLETLSENEGNAAFDVLSYWRFTHEIPLAIAFNKLQTTTLEIDKKAIFAKRLKRYISIVLKLDRFRSMQLKNMQDIGGCRAVLTTEKKLNRTARALKSLPEFQNDGLFKIKNYIKKPKDDGYRSYHIIGKFTDFFGDKKSIEIQLRTSLQHYWATALEIVDLFTGQALKSNQGKAEWKEFFLHVSEQFAVMDSIHLFDSIPLEEKFERYSKALLKDKKSFVSSQITRARCESLNVLSIFAAFSSSLKIVDNKLDDNNNTGFVLLTIDTLNNTVHPELFTKEESQLAEEKYIAAEKNTVTSEEKNIIVALVSTTAVGSIKEAYPNYFADSTKFQLHLNLIITAAKRYLNGTLEGNPNMIINAKYSEIEPSREKGDRTTTLKDSSGKQTPNSKIKSWINR